MYTTAFVQEELTREVMNCAKSRNYYADNDIIQTQTILNNEADVCVNNENKLYEPDAIFNYEGFEYAFPPEGWSMINPDDGITYMKYTPPNGPSFAGSNSIRMRFFNYTDIGQIDYLITKPYNNIETSDSLRFDWAYAPRTGFTDRLQVKVSTNGGTTFPFTIFDKSGSVLATAPDQATAFTPTSSSQWNTYKARLSDILVSVNNNGEIPLKYDLRQNFPNPFNPVTKINYSVLEKGLVLITVFDLLGRKVIQLVNEIKSPGNYEVIFDAANLSSGMYIYKMQTDKFSSVKKMVLIR
jgi:hypothetical protein